MFNCVKEILIHKMNLAHLGFCTFCPVVSGSFCTFCQAVEPEGATPNKKVYLIIDLL